MYSHTSLDAINYEKAFDIMHVSKFWWQLPQFTPARQNRHHSLHYDHCEFAVCEMQREKHCQICAKSFVDRRKKKQDLLLLL